ncbi:Rossmann-like and DUF2520 domain-containing protein [Arthrobacter castelli]|uniref:Rossmann-like and DUF2520 domain-containing protein n=1 Tax=Arthrobacter castelli TaxID=271431 RepID=UPI0004083E26|nr:DUF2520 domain-containing protein [Arthrobacter castelli]
MASKPGRLGVGVIGAGKVGAVLGAALRAAEHAVVGVSAVSEQSLDRAENLLPGVPVLEIPDIVERAELVLLAVPDDELPRLIEGLAATGAWQQGQLVAHTSGRFGVSVLDPARKLGVLPLALHPAMTFSGMSLDLARLADCSFGVTADKPILPVAQALVVEMGGEPVVIEEDDRPLYHAALAHSANHLVTLTAQSVELLSGMGVEDPARMLAPLLRASLDNALASGESALTGPVARADTGTIAAHDKSLAGQDEIQSAYRHLAQVTTTRALRRGQLDSRQAAAILRALDLPAED